MSASFSLVTAITGVAMLWVQWSHERRFDTDRPLFALWGTHGVHLFDLVVLGVEVVLVALLSAVLLAGFARRG